MKKSMISVLLCMLMLCAQPVTAESGAEKPETGADSSETSVPVEVPTAEELTEGYFEVLAGLEPGTAGVSLKTASRAAKVCAFAEEYALYDQDEKTLSANMAAAWEAMEEEKQDAFRQGFDMVNTLLDACLKDYESSRPLFEDAGAADEMDEIMNDPRNLLAWEILRDQTMELVGDMESADE